MSGMRDQSSWAGLSVVFVAHWSRLLRIREPGSWAFNAWPDDAPLRAPDFELERERAVGFSLM